MRWRLKSPASQLFTQPFIRAQIKVNIKASRHWPFFLFMKNYYSYDLISHLNSLAPGRFQFNFRWAIFNLILVNDGWGIFYEIALRWMPLDLTDDKSTLVQVMAWCRQALPEPMFTQLYVAKWRHWASMSQSNSTQWRRMVSWALIKILSGDVLEPGGTKQLSGPTQNTKNKISSQKFNFEITAGWWFFQTLIIWLVVPADIMLGCKL